MALRTPWLALPAILLASCGSSLEPRNPGPRPSWNPGDELRAAMTGGNASLQAQKFADAVKWFTLAASIEPRNADARAGRGRALLGMKKIGLARSDFEGASGLDPDCEEAFGGLGELYLETEESARAVEALDRALALNPGSARFHRLRARAHNALGNMDGAREDARKAAELGE